MSNGMKLGSQFRTQKANRSTEANKVPASVIGPKLDKNQVLRFLGTAPQSFLPGSKPGARQQLPIARDALGELQRFALPDGSKAYFAKDSLYIDKGDAGWTVARVPADAMGPLSSPAKPWHP